MHLGLLGDRAAQEQKGGMEGEPWMGGGSRGSKDVSAWGRAWAPHPSLPGARGDWLWAGGAKSGLRG